MKTLFGEMPAARAGESTVVGAQVGARRWPNHAAHPDCWGIPWRGVVLAANDPRAWKGALVDDFGSYDANRLPSQEAVDAHVARCRARGLIAEVPVLWDFGRVYWEPPQQLRPYAQDVAEFEIERAQARSLLTVEA